MNSRLVNKISMFLLAGTVMTGLTACGGSAKEIDAGALAESLVNDIEYTAELSQISDEELEFFIDMEDGVTAVMYMSSGETAEEVAVFTAPDEETASTMKENVSAFLTEQADAFAAYEPETVNRIENAVLEQIGNYVILHVSDDTAKAQEMIEQAFGE